MKALLITLVCPVFAAVNIPTYCDETCYGYCYQYYPSDQCFLACGCLNTQSLQASNDTSYTNSTTNTTTTNDTYTDPERA